MENNWIIISNNLEIKKTLLKNKRDRMVANSSILGDRSVFWCGDNKLLVTSTRIPQELINFAQELGYKNITNLSVGLKNAHRVCKSLVKSKNYWKKISDFINESKNPVSVICYAVTDDFVQLSRKLRANFPKKVLFPELPVNPEITNKYFSKTALPDMVDAINSKNGNVVFRPKTIIANSVKEILKACASFVSENEAFVVKYHKGISGEGILMVDQSMFPNYTRIVKKFVKGNKYADCTYLVESLIRPLSTNGMVNSPSAEFFCNGVVKLTYICEQYLEKGHFKGITSINLNPLYIDSISKQTQAIAFHLKSEGYEGIFDADYIVDQNGKAWLCEINPRRTGGTHIYEMGKFLYGDDYTKVQYFSNDKQDVAINLSPSKLLELLKSKNLLYDNDKKEGLIPTILSGLRFGKIGYIIFANNKRNILDYKSRFEEAII